MSVPEQFTACSRSYHVCMLAGFRRTRIFLSAGEGAGSGSATCRQREALSESGDTSAERLRSVPRLAVRGTNLCLQRPLQVKGKWVRGLGGAADREACTVQTKILFSSGIFLVDRCLSLRVGNVFLVYICV